MTEFPRAVLSDDTSLSAEERQVRRWREMSIAEKGRLVTSLCQVADAMALAGIRHRHSGASPRECFMHLAVLKLGRDLAQRVNPEISALSDAP